jgi:acyl-CoA dehydrogenase
MIPIKTALKSIESKFSDFARTQIFSLPDLGNRSCFPEALWKKMGAADLLNSALFNGQNLESHSCLAITRCGRALVYKGGNLGMALSWMIHHLVARYLLFPLGPDGGSDNRKESDNKKGADDGKFLGPLFKAMASGEATVCLAVSEPKAGAHPKYLAARATKTTTGFILNGEKTYLTNGPIAHAFIVIAVTGMDRKKKQFSAFFVPKKTPGLTMLPPLEIPFFNPSPHNGIDLKDCRVPDNALLGREGHAYGEMVLFFRRCEDAAMTGPVTGAMAFLLDGLAQAMGHKEIPGGGIKQLGGLVALLETADLLSWNVAIAVDNPTSPPHFTNAGAILLQFKALVRVYVTQVESLVEEMNLILPDHFDILIRDLKASARINEHISGIQQMKLGLALLEKTKI